MAIFRSHKQSCADMRLQMQTRIYIIMSSISYFTQKCIRCIINNTQGIDAAQMGGITMITDADFMDGNHPFAMEQYIPSSQESPGLSRLMQQRHHSIQLEQLGVLQSFEKNQVVLKAGAIPSCCYLNANLIHLRTSELRINWITSIRKNPRWILPLPSQSASKRLS